MEKISIFFTELAQIVHFAIDAVKQFPYNIRHPKETMSNIWEIGVRSVPVVAMTGLFTGMILGLQLGSAVESFISGSAIFVGAALSVSVILELGPVLSSLIVVSRVCSSVTAQLGTMRVTEQIDALKTMSVDPIQYLVSPKVLAGMISLPILGYICSLLSIIGGWIMLTLVHHVDSTTFWEYSRVTLSAVYVWQALAKTMLIGATILVVSTFYGFNTRGGADGVGKATIKSVVISSFMVILLDYLLGSLFVLFA